MTLGELDQASRQRERAMRRLTLLQYLWLHVLALTVEWQLAHCGYFFALLCGAVVPVNGWLLWRNARQVGAELELQAEIRALVNPPARRNGRPPTT